MNKFLILAIIVIIAVAAFAGCSKKDKDENVNEYHKITAEEAKDMMENQEVTIVDVRRQEEFEAGHIDKAILVPNESIGDEEISELPDKDAKLLIYCRSGRRSKEAANKLLKLGYTNVYDFGGIIDWPYEIVE